MLPRYDLATVAELWATRAGWVAMLLAMLGQICRWLAAVEAWHPIKAGRHILLAAIVGCLAWTAVHPQEWAVWQKALFYIAAGLIAPEAVRAVVQFVSSVMTSRLEEWERRLTSRDAREQREKDGPP